MTFFFEIFSPLVREFQIETPEARINISSNFKTMKRNDSTLQDEKKNEFKNLTFNSLSLFQNIRQKFKDKNMVDLKNNRFKRLEVIFS